MTVPLIKLLLLIMTVGGLLILESRWPFFAFQTTWRSRVAGNFGLGVINSVIVSLWMIAISRFGLLPPIDHGLMVLALSNPLMAGILACLILDLYMYCWHRSMHVIPFAWQFHRRHHTDRSMNVSTAYRFHPVEIISSSIPKLALIWLLGIPSNFVVIYELVFTVIVALHHSNFALPGSIDRFLAQIIVTPNLHRIHHSQLVTETNSNYGSVLIWWDRLFATRRDRRDIINIQLGLPDEAVIDRLN
jgi:sterol desaturase/sphingolipid hydroxylase (fatty acid hydroxylase superfamily)